jgi:two-component system nitrogen regulation response regulator GlnG
VLFWIEPDPGSDVDELGIPGRSRAIRELRARIRDASRAGPTLLVGESGAGKELVARAIHASGPRSNAPFVVVNVAAIPAPVAAAELFGHERGAFTGAGEKRAGYFERAHRGVLFLDEIGELPEAIQPMLLRALESGEVQPVGGLPRAVDVHVVAATDADLKTAAATGRFRGPLYFRLATSTLRVPPLRERRIDIALLFARFFAAALPDAFCDQTNEAALTLPASIVAELMRRSWPGNVRELRSAAQRLAGDVRAGRRAQLGDLGSSFEEHHLEPIKVASAVDDERLVAALHKHRFQLNRTAEALGISRTHLDALIMRSPRVRKAKDLPREEIAACAQALDNDVDAMAAQLEVSPRGLRLRMRQLGM